MLSWTFASISIQLTFYGRQDTSVLVAYPFDHLFLSVILIHINQTPYKPAFLSIAMTSHNQLRGLLPNDLGLWGSGIDVNKSQVTASVDKSEETRLLKGKIWFKKLNFVNLDRKGICVLFRAK